MTIEREVPRVKTTPTAAEWRRGILDAAQELGIYLTESSLAVLWAQWALETGRGEHCYCDNLGNIKHVDGDGRAWMWLDTFEYLGGKRVNMPDRFRAFDALFKGALDYLTFLSRASYALAWTQVLRGDPGAFAHALYALRYMTADPDVYASGLRSLVSEYFRAIAADLAPASGTPTRPETPKAIEAGLELGDANANADPLWRGGEGEKTYDPDQTAPDGVSIIDFAEELYERLRGSLVCSTCEDPPSPQEAA